jgi:hypothetical protein
MTVEEERVITSHMNAHTILINGEYRIGVVKFNEPSEIYLQLLGKVITSVRVFYETTCITTICPHYGRSAKADSVLLLVGRLAASSVRRKDEKCNYNCTKNSQFTAFQANHQTLHGTGRRIPEA